MPSQRPLVLAGILIALLLGYAFRSNFSHPEASFRQTIPPSELVPLPGKNSISGLTIRQDKQGAWRAEFEYYYTGEPKFAALRIELAPSIGSSISPIGSQRRDTYLPAAQRGQHHVSAAIAYPGGEQTTRQISAKLLRSMTGDQVIASQEIDAVINWPTFQTWIQQQQMVQSSPESNLNRAVQLIDSESAPQLSEAKAILEQLIAQNAQFDAAYVELARIAMKSNWGPEGLHQAEALLSSALQIKPANVNAKILLGYVYSHQNRFTKAEALFSEAASSDTRNLWLWTNWGEMLAMQGKLEQAADKYRRAITEPMTHDTYDRARAEAYSRLLELLQRREDLDGMEVLYKQRIGEFGPGSCYSSDYARFKLQVRGDTQGAIDLARGALNQDCEDSEARQILGLAEYVKWAADSGAERAKALNQARIYLPVGPMPLYLLAKSDRTVRAAKALIVAGEQIDQRDNDGLTALAHALQDGDLVAAKRLLMLGARADAPIGIEQMPVALLPVMEGKIEAVRMMRRSGVDYSKLRFRGTTAIDFAKQTGNSQLLDALGQKASLL
jgi:tetratricopeptide (TPR) repeat protein